MLRSIIRSQIWLSERFDRLLPSTYRIDGNSDFLRDFAPRYLPTDATIYDIGSGRHPLLSADQKRRLRVKVVGLDIDANELASAPDGTYDAAVCSDITKYQGSQDADLAVCQALLEHVNGVDQAFRAIASTLKPGGTAIVFVPSRNAVFARLNLVLPESLKRKILFTIYPQARHIGQGFTAYYDRCTPKDFQQLAKKYGLEVVEARHYYRSGYFTFLFPLHVLWRLWVLGFKAVSNEQAAETFSMAFRKTT